MRYLINIETKDETVSTFHSLTMEAESIKEVFDNVEIIVNMLGGDISNVNVTATPSLKVGKK